MIISFETAPPPNGSFLGGWGGCAPWRGPHSTSAVLCLQIRAELVKCMWEEGGSVFLARSAPYDCRVMLVELFCCACEVHVGRGGSVLLAGSAPYYCSVTPVGWCCACEVHVGGRRVGVPCEVRTLSLLLSRR